jgi:C-terminal processing protease CtpA/Prc
MTVTRDCNTHRTAVVSRVVKDGQAAQVGIQVGDVVIGIENKWIEGYDDFLTKMKDVKQYPVSLVIRRTKRK